MVAALLTTTMGQPFVAPGTFINPERDTELLAVSRAGDRLLQLTATSGGFDGEPKWHPQDGSIIYQSQSSPFRVDGAQGLELRILRDPLADPILALPQ